MFFPGESGGEEVAGTRAGDTVSNGSADSGDVDRGFDGLDVFCAPGDGTCKLLVMERGSG